MIAFAPLICFCLFLLLAAIQDAVSLRISNLVSAGVLLSVLAALALHSLSPPWWEHILSFALALGMGTALFSLGWLGGGDVKLFAAASLWFDLDQLVMFIAVMAGLGGLLVIALFAWRTIFTESRNLSGAKRKFAVPYGIPIAAAAIGMALVPAISPPLSPSSFVHGRANMPGSN